jgi:MoaA/NifB/PqqE/SkfB family radical SAM enzyme
VPAVDGGSGYDLGAPFLFSPGGNRLIQIQPSLRCNLRCRHCYTESGPEHGGAIPVARFERFLSEARALGYDYVGVSGGEPLLWRDLREFLALARGTGFTTSITTNGTLLTEARVEELRGLANLIAVSVDGPPAEHAALRGSTRAFPAMLRGLAALRASGLPFGLVFTLTRRNAHRVRWLYEFAEREGAFGIQVHPLCDFGFASVHLRGAVPDTRELRAAAWLLALLREVHGPGGPVVTLDAIARKRLEESCWPLLTGNAEALAASRFADVVPSLIVEPDGGIVPFIYGFPRRWALGQLGGEPLATAARRWRAASGAPASALLRSTLARLAAEGAELVDFFAAVLEDARREELVPGSGSVSA